ncbi:MAG: alpha/beta fold hydrolase [Phaeodactylibacter sp.]|nr:alpha/beta fold hydrolase [Phaeodactylibacter sp.]
MLELNYKTFGQGDPLIILHGLFGTLDNWQTLGKKLAEQYTVYLIDQRNHGRSPHDDEHTYAAMAEDLHYFMESHWMFKAHIIGHSMGGKTAMAFAHAYPDMVDKLVVVDIAPKAYQGGHELIFKALQSLDLDTIGSRSEAEAVLKAQIHNLGIRQFLLKNLSRDKSGGYRWKMNLSALWAHYADILAVHEGVQLPYESEVLFVRGGKSDYIQDEDTAALELFFPHYKLQTIENAGHWVHAEAPAELQRVMETFLAA